MYVLGQIVGMIGFVVSVISFLQKNDKKMKNYLGASSVLVAVSYFMIGALAGSISMLISAARNFSAAYGAKNKYLCAFFMGVTIVCGYYTYKTPYDLLPIVGALVATAALFLFEKVTMRVLLIVACALWLIYDIINSAVGPILMQTFNICACLYAIRSLKVQKTEPALS